MKKLQFGNHMQKDIQKTMKKVLNKNDAEKREFGKWFGGLNDVNFFV